VNYDALDAQWRLVSKWLSGDGVEWSHKIFDNTKRTNLRPDIGDRPNNIRLYRREIIGVLIAASPFQVESDICRILEAGVKSLPDVPLTLDMLPVVTGFAYLEKACAFPNTIDQLRGFSWHVKKFMLIPGTQRDPNLLPAFDAVDMLFYDNALCPFSHLSWTLGENWGSDWYIKEGPAIELDGAMTLLRQYVFSLMSFVNQKIVKTYSVLPDRSQQRRITRESGKDHPLVTVVTLRHSVEGNKVAPVARNWQCRWFVRGHWRKQWYRSTQSHKAIWILPYVKGPEAKPLKQPAIKFFEVSR
jgi:hypothetical protein